MRPYRFTANAGNGHSGLLKLKTLWGCIPQNPPSYSGIQYAMTRSRLSLLTLHSQPLPHSLFLSKWAVIYRPTPLPNESANHSFMHSSLVLFIHDLSRGGGGGVTSIPGSHPNTSTARQQRDDIHPVGYKRRYLAITGDFSGTMLISGTKR